MKTEQLAAALLADRNREVQERTDITKCFICGYSMVYRGSRFCSDRCREWFDAGNNPVDNYENYSLTGWRVIAGPPGIEIGSDYYAGIFGRQPPGMKPSRYGFYIPCAHCKKDFECKGEGRTCSDECARGLREHEANLAIMAERGIEPAAKKTCIQYGAIIPKWRKGRRVSATVRFCSGKCGQKYRQAQ